MMPARCSFVIIKISTFNPGGTVKSVEEVARIFPDRGYVYNDSFRYLQWVIKQMYREENLWTY